MLFTRRPQDIFIQSGVKCIRFKGTDITADMLDFKDIEGDLFSQVEEVGSGTNKIINWCKEWELPEAEIGISGTSIFVRFRKDIFTEKYLEKLGLNERQIKAVLYAKTKGKITNKEYQNL
uniref:Uncharacterized protein n=1 Tax=candidate division WOR-3 bacterium TaxID=2052148 RepID=A0A7C4YSL3_UNCW3